MTLGVPPRRQHSDPHHSHNATSVMTYQSHTCTSNRCCIPYSQIGMNCVYCTHGIITVSMITKQYSYTVTVTVTLTVTVTVTLTVTVTVTVTVSLILTLTVTVVILLLMMNHRTLSSLLSLTMFHEKKHSYSKITWR